MTMRRTLGSGGPAVFPVGLGAMGMSGISYGPADEREAVATIRAALDAGVNHIDTADVYGTDGHNERLVGRAIAGRRDAAVVATKFGFIAGPDGLRVDGRPERVAGCVEASLARLGVEVIDLLYLHRVDARVPVEDSVGAMAEQVARGTVRHLGLSEASAATVRRANAVHRIAAVQSEYSLWWREPEAELLPTLRELGIALVAFSPVGRGLLGGSMPAAEALAENDLRRRLPRFQGANLDRNRALAAVVAEVAAEVGATPGQVALAWLLVQDPLVLPIPGMRSPARLAENAAAAALTLPETALRRLDAAFGPDAAAGERYPEELARLIDR